MSGQTSQDFEIGIDVIWFEDDDTAHKAIVTGTVDVYTIAVRDLRDGEMYELPVAIVYYF